MGRGKALLALGGLTVLGVGLGVAAAARRKAVPGPGAAIKLSIIDQTSGEELTPHSPLDLTVGKPYTLKVTVTNATRQDGVAIGTSLVTSYFLQLDTAMVVPVITQKRFFAAGESYTYTASFTPTARASGSAQAAVQAEAQPGVDLDTDSLTINAYRLPVANFSYSPAVVSPGEAVSFTNLSIGDWVNSLWDFGDGSTSMETNPVHIYRAPGVYTVSLSVFGPVGQDTKTVRDAVYVFSITYAASIAVGVE